MVEGDDDGVSYTVQAEHAALGRRDGGRSPAPADTDVTVTPASLTFTSSNWDQAQTVTVSSRGGSATARTTMSLSPTPQRAAATRTRLGGRQGGGAGRRRRRLCGRRRTGRPRRPLLSLSSGWFRRMRHPRSPSTATTPRAASPIVPGAEFCQVERLTGYETGLALASGDWPDEMYAGTCAGVTLEASTTYWVVFRSLSQHPNSFYRVAESNSNSEDTAGAAGWSIGNQTFGPCATRPHQSAAGLGNGVGQQSAGHRRLRQPQVAEGRIDPPGGSGRHRAPGCTSRASPARASTTPAATSCTCSLSRK